MKKTKIFIIITIMILSSCFITGCGKKENDKTETKTVATILIETFESELKKEKDLEKIAQKIAENEAIVPEVQTFSITEEDFLSGFKEEITGYKKAIGIAPMISTIPFIAYIFEVDNPKEFTKKLEENYQLNWNICVEADEMKTSIVDNYVFFVMSPNNFEQ